MTSQILLNIQMPTPMTANFDSFKPVYGNFLIYMPFLIKLVPKVFVSQYKICLMVAFPFKKNEYTWYMFPYYFFQPDEFLWLPICFPFKMMFNLSQKNLLLMEGILPSYTPIDIGAKKCFWKSCCPWKFIHLFPMTSC